MFLKFLFRGLIKQVDNIIDYISDLFRVLIITVIKRFNELIPDIGFVPKNILLLIVIIIVILSIFFFWRFISKNKSKRTSFFQKRKRGHNNKQRN